MNDEPKWDDALERYLAGELDRQLGRSVEHFVQGEIVPFRPIKALPERTLLHRRRWRTAGWLAAAAVTLAAGIAAWSRQAPPDNGLRMHEHGSQGGLQAGQARPAKSTVHASPKKRLPAGRAAAVGAKQPRPVQQAQPVQQARLVQQAVRWRTLDEGTVMLDGRAVRKLRRQRLERVEWWDQVRGVRIQTLAPREEVVLVAIPTH